MAKSYTADQEVFEIGERQFLVTAWPALKGLELQARAQDEITGLGRLSPGLMKEMVKGVSVNNICIDSDKLFDQTFSRKYGDLMQLIQKIMEFNFGKEEEFEDGEGSASPKEESVTAE